MAVGRPPKPTQMKLVSGNPGKRELNKKEPKPKRKNPLKPRHLTGVASEYWDRLRENLLDLGILAGADEDMMEQMAKLYADIRLLQEKVDTQGFTYLSEDEETGKKLVKANPAAAQLRAAQTLFKNMLTEFGLTPSSRSRVKTDNEEGDGEDKADRHFG